MYGGYSNRERWGLIAQMTGFIGWGIENRWRGFLLLRNPADSGRATQRFLHKWLFGNGLGFGVVVFLLVR